MALARKAAAHRPQNRGRRGLNEDRLIAEVAREIERMGLERFSMRSAARAIGCDAATLIYHFGSKEGLERRVADQLHTAIRKPDPTLAWDQRLVFLARQYRALAKRKPKTFPLLLRYWTTGPADLEVAEEFYRALADAGVPPAVLPALETGLYAAILGLCSGEVGGLVRAPVPSTLAEIESKEGLEIMRSMLAQICRIHADDVFEHTIRALVVGLGGVGQPAKTCAPQPVKAASTPARPGCRRHRT